MTERTNVIVLEHERQRRLEEMEKQRRADEKETEKRRQEEAKEKQQRDEENEKNILTEAVVQFNKIRYNL